MRRFVLPILFLSCVVDGPPFIPRPCVGSVAGTMGGHGGEHGGKPMDSIKGGVMTVVGEGFEIRTASGNILKGTLRLDVSTPPFKMDLLHADGEVWEAVYETTADTFRLNYVEKGGKDPRPTSFTTSEKTEESIVTLRRESPAK